MTTALLCSNPLYGHVNPMLAVGRDLAARGDRVIVLTGSRFETATLDSGLEFRSFHGAADFDERDPASFVPDAHRYSGIALSQYQVESTFIRPIPDQWRALSAILAEEQIDVVLIDSLFVGALPLLQRDPGKRLPVLVIGIGPLAQFSVDTPPANSRIRMASGPVARVRNRLLNEMARRVFFAHAQRLAGQLLIEAGGQKPDGFVIEISRLPDRYLQLGPREFEYERRDLSDNIRFVGPLSSARTPGAAESLPDWWGELGDGKPIVHVTQGTLDNHDPSTVIRPTIDALADLDLHVVVSTGRSPIESVGPLPPNARIAEFLPYDQLLPLCDVMVTNGGYGGTLAALAAGVPLVVAGAAEDKPEVAARVDYFGVGIDLRTGRPTAHQVRAAVQRILHDASFRRRAATLRDAIAGYDPFRNIRHEIDTVLTERRL
ncbi:glycosyltransferase [Compostimonas suwonensis]|uniref:MGT family glycosyltransferase n=1 Tax=Compostimonas suwonensis TaxID=1048394 RepID=A0A2M9BZC2_9MICO|nr:glycosyltransferase [Compostimonas suwonensis]PJJ63433.1 MGT family glycosyltransferase [Compostimonas suwonensis]